MATMTQSVATNWRNTHTHVDRRHSLTHFTSTQLQPRCAKRQLSYYRVWKHNFILKEPEGGGANRSTQRKPPTTLQTDHTSNGFDWNNCDWRNMWLWATGWSAYMGFPERLDRYHTSGTELNSPNLSQHEQWSWTNHFLFFFHVPP